MTPAVSLLGTKKQILSIKNITEKYTSKCQESETESKEWTQENLFT